MMLAYNKICQFYVNYEIAMFHSTRSPRLEKTDTSFLCLYFRRRRRNLATESATEKKVWRPPTPVRALRSGASIRRAPSGRRRCRSWGCAFDKNFAPRCWSWRDSGFDGQKHYWYNNHACWLTEECLERTQRVRACQCVRAWTNFSLQDEPWAEFSTLEVAAACIPCTYCPV